MNATQITRQAQACHIRFKQLVSEGAIPDGITIYQYAGQILGHRVESLKALSASELNVLRDALEGKPNKVYDAICRHAADAGIRDLEAWVRVCSRSAPMAFLRGYANVRTMPVNKQWRLCRILECRARSMRPEPDAAIRIICAWCGVVLTEGPAGAATSHGICEKCAVKQLERVNA